MNTYILQDGQDSFNTWEVTSKEITERLISIVLGDMEKLGYGTHVDTLRDRSVTLLQLLAVHDGRMDFELLIRVAHEYDYTIYKKMEGK